MRQRLLQLRRKCAFLPELASRLSNGHAMLSSCLGSRKHVRPSAALPESRMPDKVDAVVQGARDKAAPARPGVGICSRTPRPPSRRPISGSLGRPPRLLGTHPVSSASHRILLKAAFKCFGAAVFLRRVATQIIDFCAPDATPWPSWLLASGQRQQRHWPFLLAQLAPRASWFRAPEGLQCDPLSPPVDGSMRERRPAAS